MRSWLLLLVACNSGTLPVTSSDQAESCEPDAELPAGAQIVACGFSPHLELIGADGEAVYVATAGGQFFRVDPASATKTLLHFDAGAVVTGEGRHLHLAGGRLFFVSQQALWSIDAAAPSSPRQVLTDFAEDPVITEDAIYWLQQLRDRYVEVRRAPLTGGPGERFSSQVALPIAAAAGYVYLTTFTEGSAIYPPFPQLLRVPIAGGDPAVVVPELFPATSNVSGVGALAAGQRGVYLLKGLDRQQNVYPIVYYPTDLSGSQVIGRLAGPSGDFPGDAPGAIRLDGDDVYFSNGGLDFGAVVTLLRLTPTGVTPIHTATSLGAPVFDASSIYVAYQRGGVTSPIEGVVARIPK